MANEQLTLLIPTHQRPRYLDRLLRYLARAGHRSPVLVADSSSEGTEIAREAVARANDHFPCKYLGWKPPIGWYPKTYEALQQVTTPLVAMCADDDFVVPSTLKAAADRLARDPTAAVAHGRAMALAMDLGAGVDPVKTMRSRSRRHLVAEHDSPVDRVAHFLRNYASIFYSVTRTAHLTRAFKHMSELNQDYDFGMTMAGCLSLVAGKAVAVDGLYYVVMDTAIGLSRSSSNLLHGWRGLLTKADYSARYGNFKKVVLDELESTANVDRAEAESKIDAAFVDYLVDRLVNNRMGELERLLKNARQAKESLVRLSAVASRGVRTVLSNPSSVRDLRSPRRTFARWAGALDPLSLDALREGPEAPSIAEVLSAIETYPG